MLASAETVDLVAEALEMHGHPIAIIDPVCRLHRLRQKQKLVLYC